MTQTVWIARHANRLDFVSPEWFNTAERRYDPPLSDDGLIQVKELAHRLKSEKITRIFASPFLRTVQTACGIAEVLDLPVTLDWGLCEWLNGDWMTEMPEIEPFDRLCDRFAKINSTVPIRGIPHYPETEKQCLHRAGKAINKLVTEFPDDELLCVGHGASVLGMTMGLVDGIGKSDVNASLACLVKVVRNGEQWIMELNGDTSHLSSSESTIRFN
ncbi:histidine phosphatase family protein [Roseofilum casamattae]|uniref:Histidine phosphatase family protein n=1 Tax=Roseofilum casamattae BLCC-M143 TaxID=3022442 RepID=A0ABT7BQW9_9CYAN|nr:histidine phosphatase family protein [Roseofilum casamattae]MDJ1181591.1 histidine phosphatase family protein [Roseofilum casamattae BLCC-M143]